MRQRARFLFTAGSPLAPSVSVFVDELSDDEIAFLPLEEVFRGWDDGHPKEAMIETAELLEAWAAKFRGFNDESGVDGE